MFRPANSRELGIKSHYSINYKLNRLKILINMTNYTKEGRRVPNDKKQKTTKF